MKRLIFCFLLSISINLSFGQTKMSPELDQFIVLSPKIEQNFVNNLYSGWMGINHFGDDWLTIAQEVFQNNDQLLNQQIYDGKLANNFYTDRLTWAFDLPKNIDIFDNITEPHSKLLSLSDYLAGNQQLLEFIPVPVVDSKYLNTRDYFACRIYLKHDCLAEIKKDESYIRTVILTNQKLLTRFRELIAQSEFNYALLYNDFNTARTIKAGLNMTQLYQLNLSDAVLDIMNQQVDEGLDKLLLARQLIDLNFREQSMPLMNNIVIYISYTQYLDQTMNALLSSGLLSQYLDDQRLEMILKPYPADIGQKLNASIINELKHIFRSIIYPFVRIYIDAPQDRQFSEENEYIILSYFQEKTIMIPIHLLYRLEILEAKRQNESWLKVQSLNQLRDKSSQNIGRKNNIFANSKLKSDEMSVTAKINLQEWYTDFFHQLDMSPEEAFAYLNTKYPSVKFYNEYYKLLEKLTLMNMSKENVHFTSQVLDTVLKDEVSPTYQPYARTIVSYSDFGTYWMRLYEQQNYHRLVYLKYLIIRNNVSSKDIDQFLKSKNELARNTITDQPYEYDGKNKILSTPLPIDNKYLPVNIKQAKFDNRSIKNFQVDIP